MGMEIDYSIPGEVKVYMIDNLNMIINEFPELIVGTSVSPAVDRLFTVRPDEERTMLDKKQAITFHHCVTQLLFTPTRPRKDIQLAVSLLTMRVQIPDEYDWAKLKRLIRYTRGTIHMPLLLRTNSLDIIKWWVNASFATHDNCTGHTCVIISLGQGSIIGMSKKHKINTRGSTEVELVGDVGTVPHMIWTRYIIEAQGFDVEESILNQNNTSAMMLETNGRQSSSNCTKHTYVRYFFIKDKVTSK
jgi:hypothetical protein